MLLFEKTVASWESGLWWPILRTALFFLVSISRFHIVRTPFREHQPPCPDILTIGSETVLAHIRLTIHKIAERRSLKPENRGSIRFGFIYFRI